MYTFLPSFNEISIKWRSKGIVPVGTNWVMSWSFKKSKLITSAIESYCFKYSDSFLNHCHWYFIALHAKKTSCIQRICIPSHIWESPAEYHWDCSDWAGGSANPLPNLTEVPGGEVKDNSSFHSNESNESNSKQALPMQITSTSSQNG